MGVKSGFLESAPKPATVEPEIMGLQAIADATGDKKPDVKTTINWPADLHAQIVLVKKEEFCDFAAAVRMLVLESIRVRNNKKFARMTKGR